MEKKEDKNVNIKEVLFNIKTKIKMEQKNENNGMCKLIQGYLKTIK